jgi:hypothetical protein
MRRREAGGLRISVTSMPWLRPTARGNAKRAALPEEDGPSKKIAVSID